MQQLFLDFPKLEEETRPLIETGAYQPVLQLLRNWKAWPEGQLALIGEAQSGKTRLLRTWAAETGGAVLTAQALANADTDELSNLSLSALAIDDADKANNGPNLLAAINLCHARKAPILLAGATHPSTWYSDPPDLLSRLKAMPVTQIEGPDEDALRKRLEDACARRHFNVPGASLKFLVERMDYRWDAVEELANAIEQTKGRAFTVRSARKVLDSLE